MTTPLDYRGPDPGDEPPRPSISGPVLALLSLGCVAVPVVGWITRSGPLFLCGGALAPVVGVILAVLGIAGGAREDAGLCGVALVANGAVIAYFGWMFFVRGVC